MSASFDDQNPFASPMTDEAPASQQSIELSKAEQVRKEHINHEASVQSIGILYYLGVAGILIVFSMLVFAIASGENGEAMSIVIAALCLFFIVLQIWIGRGLRTLNGSVRIAAIVLSCLGLLSFPVGTLINGYIIYMLACRKGIYVMSPEYQEIRAATPHIKYRTPLYMWVIVGLLVLLIGSAIVFALL